MGVYLNPGNGMFQEAVQSEIYVDKTELIKYTNKAIGTSQKNICISRPRRFGKSMAASMLVAYYDESKTYVSRDTSSVSFEFTIPEDCYYIRFSIYNYGSSTYNNDVRVYQPVLEE